MDKPRQEDLPPSLAADSALAMALEHWIRRRTVSGLPGGDLVDPLQLPRCILPYVLLIDFCGDRIHYRLVGTAMCERWGSDITGKYLDEIMSGDYAEYVSGLYYRCRDSRLPVFSESRFRWDTGRVLRTRRLMLPFLDGSDGSLRIMVVQTFGGEEPTANGSTVPVLIDHSLHHGATVVLSQVGGRD